MDNSSFISIVVPPVDEKQEKKERVAPEISKKPINKTLPSKRKQKMISPRYDGIESSPSEQNADLFFQYAKDGNEDGIKQLLSLGIAVNATNRYGYTALMRATINGRLNVIDVLLQANANIFLKDHKGRTALHHSVKEKQEKATFKLLAHISGEQRAILRNNSFFNDTVTKFEARLNSKRFDINTQNMKGETMFMLAARYGHQKTAENLIKQGANIHLKNIYGKTAEEQAKDYRESFRDALPKRTEELYQQHMLIFSFAEYHTHLLPRIGEIDQTAIITEGLKNINLDKKAPR